MFFDSHCHLTSSELAPQFDEVLARAVTAGVTAFLNIGDTLESSQRALEQTFEARQFGLEMWATAGVHPHNASEWQEHTERKLRALAEAEAVVAIGEIGLDFVYDENHPVFPGASRELQEHVLREQLRLALELNLPVVLHNREADARLPGVVAEFPGLRGVFHCFGSPQQVAREVLDLGFHLGFTGLVTFKNADAVREVVRHCPLDKLLIETDSPYLAPVPQRGKTNEPSLLPHVAQTVAMVHGLTDAEIAAQTDANARRLFGLAG